MLPGQSHQIPSMGMPPGYAPMMQWEDPGGMPQQVIMMTAPTGQQIALTSVYPMPQNAMMPGQQRFMPPPPPYSVQMASSFRTGVARNNEPLQMTDEQRKKMEKEAKQRQFMEQQRRLQGLSNLGSVKMDPDKLIESIIGKSETAHRAPTARPPAAPLAKGAQGFESGEDVFGDFLGVSAASPARGVAHHSTAAPPSTASSYAKPKPLGNNVLCENNTLSSAGEISSVKKTEGTPKEKKDLASMMMQCSDLTAPKEAKRFEKRKTVNEVQVTKSVSVTYSESKAARHWDSSTEALSELFMLPANPVSQPSATFETFEGTATSPVMTSEFRLPPWITGEIPIHNLYQQVLEAVTRDGVILTELVYPLLLQSGLPREALGYIWELCNRYTPGQLIREELFLILAMVSIAQNGLDYSSLAILSKCPQPPVPNMGQLLGSPVPQQMAPFSGATLGELSTGNTTPAVGASALSMTASFPSQTVDPTSYPQRTTVQVAPTDLSVPDDNWRVSGQVQNLGYAVHEGSLPISSFSCQHPAASVLVAGQSTADDDEFEQFQAAPLPPHGLSLSSVNSGAAPTAMPLHLPNPHTSRGEFELMKMDDDKYAALRDLTSFSATESEADVSAAVALETQTTSAVTDATVPADTADLEFADFASFSDASASDIPVSHVSTFSDNSFNLLQSHSAANVHFGIRSQDVDEFSSFSSQMKLGAESARDIATAKPYVMEPSGFTTKPPGGLLNSQSASLSGNGLDDHVQSDARAEVRVEEDGGWGSFSSSGEGRSFSQTDQSRSSTLVSGHAKPLQGADVSSDGSNLSKGVDGWAEFESASNLDKGGMFGENQRPSSSDDRASFPGSSKQMAEAKHTNKARHENISADKVRSFFGQVNDNTVAAVGMGISPLDFHPPDLPDEEEEFDDFAVYSTYPRDGNSASGISSLSMHYLEDEHFDSLSEEKNTPSAAVNGKTFTVLGMTQSNSSNSLEFTGWKLQSGAAVKEPDVHSTSSLELRHNKNSDFRDESPQQDGDSQSVSSLDFPPIESEQKSTTDEQSVASLELKPTSPESDTHPSGDSRTSDKVPPTGDARNSGFTFKDSGQGQSHPVDLKELLEQGSLGKFGDRYSELTNEVQDSDRHAYDWQRCLEICNGFLSEGNSTFSSLSSSSVLHEILSTDEGATYLKGLVEIYFVARRIEEEMRFVSVNNSKLASVVKEIDIEWNDLAAICAGSSIMPDLSSLSFQSSFLKADNVEARRKACGVCLLNVDVRDLDIFGDSGSRSLNYGGRQYHTSCANFWINCVSKTLPSLTIPELL